MSKNKKGFTLVELLGVVIILSILALIVVPNIIDSVRSKSVSVNKIQQEMILKSAGVYVSDHEGLFPRTKNNVYCIALEDMIADEYLNLEDSDIVGTKSVKVSYTNKYSYDIIDSGECKQKRIFTPATDEKTGRNPKGNFDIGDAYDVYVNDTDIYRFYVISVNDEDDTVSLIMNKNIYYNQTTGEGEGSTSANKGLTPWYKNSASNASGPTTALEYLYNATKNWTNINSQQINYKDENIGVRNGELVSGTKTKGYNNISTTGEVTKIYNKSNTSTLTVGTMENPLRARLPEMGELMDAGCTETNLTCPDWLYNNLKTTALKPELSNIDGVSGYWTLSSVDTTSTITTSSATNAWTVEYNGRVSGEALSNNTTDYGVRPVITIPKYDLDPYYTVPYTITYDCDSNDCTTFQNKVKKGLELSVNFNNPPLRLLVQRDGENYTDYTYENGKLYISKVDGNFKITCLENEYIVTYNNIDEAAKLPSTVKKGEDLEIPFKNKPSEVTVYKDNQIIKNGYIYDKNSGKLIVYNVDGDIHVAGHFNITYTDIPGSNNLPNTWEVDTKLEIQMPKDSYGEYPYKLLITMSGISLVENTGFTYSNQTGILVINKVTGPLTITRQRQEYTIVYSSTNPYTGMQAKVFRHDNIVFADTNTVKVYKSDGTVDSTRKAPVSYTNIPTKITTTMKNASNTAIEVNNFTFASNKFTLNDITGDVNITAYYTITYNSNGDTKNPASVSPGNVVVKGGENTTLPTPTRAGFEFLGWSTSTSGSAQYNAGSSYNTYKDITLYAIWKDITKPTCTIALSGSANSYGWRNDNTTVTITYDDNVAPVTKQYYTSANSTKTNYTSGISQGEANGLTYTGYVVDAAGNSNTCTSAKIYIDKTKPTCSVSKTSSTVNTTGGVSVTVTCNDTGGSTCATGTQTGSGLKANKTYSVTDKAGNSGSCTATISSTTDYCKQTRSVSQYKACASAGCAAYNSCYKKVNNTCTWQGCTQYSACTSDYSAQTCCGGKPACVATFRDGGKAAVLKKNALSDCQRIQDNRINANDLDRAFWTIDKSCPNDCVKSDGTWVCYTTMKHWIIRVCRAGNYWYWSGDSTSYVSSCTSANTSKSCGSSFTKTSCTWGAYSGCGCKTYNRGAACGVESYTDYGGCSYVSSCSTNDTTKCTTRVRYS